jgi:hypothetical protein
MASGALPRLDKVLEQRLLSPEICRRWWRSCGTLSGNLPSPLGFSVPRLLIGEGASSGAARALSHLGGAARAWAAPAWREGPSWPHSYSSLVLWKLPGKIRLLELISSNSENISCVAFLKHKIGENRKLALLHLVSRLVPEIA